MAGYRGIVTQMSICGLTAVKLLSLDTIFFKFFSDNLTVNNVVKVENTSRQNQQCRGSRVTQAASAPHHAPTACSLTSGRRAVQLPWPFKSSSTYNATRFTQYPIRRLPKQEWERQGIGRIQDGRRGCVRHGCVRRRRLRHLSDHQAPSRPCAAKLGRRARQSSRQGTDIIVEC